MPSAGLPLANGQSYSALVNQPAGCGGGLLVKAGDVGGSYLYNKVTGAGMCSGSKMPKGKTLSSNQIALIEAWICNGAKND